MTLWQLQDRISKWHRQAFPDATSNEILEKLDEECDELDEQLFLNDGMNDGCHAEEMADVFIALLALAAKTGIDLEAETLKKHSVNLTRKWYRDKDTKEWKRDKSPKSSTDNRPSA